ncbi:LCP family protein [Streptomyces sp. URMC 123]|uniref:LCP family protein n=1 Tax=Streptomyces sp. URMC 123 TaxID=3423403 RepID=UPI003F1B8C3B
MRQSSVDSTQEEGGGGARQADGRRTVVGPRDGGDGPRRAGGRRRRSPGSAPATGAKARRRRILRWSALTVAVLILGTACAGYLYIRHLNGNLRKDALDLGDSSLDKPEPNAFGQTPLNILLLGSDSRNSEANLRLGGSHKDRDRKPLADVQMLLHVSADRSNMTVISIPRDTRVTIPKCTDPDDGKVYAKTDSETINASLQNGGPGCTVAAWKELTGIYIDHFMMIDFAGVVSMADAVGGVPVCVSDNVEDKQSGLKLPKGDSVVAGEQALQWLRTRHGWEGGSDIARAKGQHMYMNSMVRQLKSGTKLTDPGKLTGLAEAATKALTVDPGLGTVKRLYDLGNDLKRVPTERISMVTMPWVPDPRNPNAHVVPKPGEAEQLFEMVRNDVALDGKDEKKPEPSPPPAAPKGEIAVTVQNGTGSALRAPVRGRAAQIAEELGRQGFTKATADTTRRVQPDTSVSYPGEDRKGDAMAVAEALGLPKSAVKLSKSVQKVTLVIGGDWRTGTAFPKAEAKEETKAPESVDALKGDDAKACMKVDPRHRW